MTTNLWCKRCKTTDHDTDNHPTQMRPDLIAAAPGVRRNIARRWKTGDYE